MDYGAILGGVYCGVVGGWFLFLLLARGRPTCWPIRLGLMLSGASFIAFGVVTILGGLGVAWVTLELRGWTFVPCLLCSGWAWLASRKSQRTCPDTDPQPGS